MENYRRKEMQEEIDVGNKYDDILQSQQPSCSFKIFLMTIIWNIFLCYRLVGNIVGHSISV